MRILGSAGNSALRIAAVAGAMAVAMTFGTARTASAQDDVYVKAAKTQFDNFFSLALRTAEKVGEDLYSFKPTPEVRSLGGVLGHIADGNMLLCRIANGDGVKVDQSNEKKTSKAEIIAALKESKSFCDGIFAKLNDTTGKEPVQGFGPNKQPKLSWLNFNNAHVMEHYGNLVTYMRLKGIVPPSSEKPM